MTELSFREVVKSRFSPRQFLPEPVDAQILQAVLLDAQRAPSNCNTQPWQTHVVSGDARGRVTAAMMADAAHQRYTPDFSWDETLYTGLLGERRRAQGKAFYESVGIARDDKDGRAKAWRDNLHFYDAPHAAFLFLPVIGDSVRTASDVGMYAQNFLLSLAAHGLAGIPQTLLGMFAEPIRQSLGVGNDLKLLFGISFGHADPNGLSARLRMERAPLEESVTFHD